MAQDEENTGTASDDADRTGGISAFPVVVHVLCACHGR
jgi:hypothetical protein